MGRCVFCNIIGGSTLSYKVYEDENCVAFMSSLPINPGHILVIPRKHEPDFYKLPGKDYLALMAAVQRLAESINTTYQPKKVGLLIAGWDVPHTHIHLIPMHDYHDITSKKLLEETIAKPSKEELSAEASKIKKSLS